MTARRTLTWVVVAILGVALTTGATLTTTLLVQQPIGLSSEPLSTSDALAPTRTAQTQAAVAKAKKSRSRGQKDKTIPAARTGSTTTTAATRTVTLPADENGAQGPSGNGTSANQQGNGQSGQSERDD